VKRMGWTSLMVAVGTGLVVGLTMHQAFFPYTLLRAAVYLPLAIVFGLIGTWISDQVRRDTRVADDDIWSA
jgi:hypothetical protein